MTERALHLAVAAFLDRALPTAAEWNHSPQQGHGRKPSTAALLWAMGARAGWPDLEIVYGGRVHFIELKGPKGRVTPAQRERLARLHEASAGRTAICKSLDEVAGTLRGWGIPMKARLAA